MNMFDFITYDSIKNINMNTVISPAEYSAFLHDAGKDNSWAYMCIHHGKMILTYCKGSKEIYKVYQKLREDKQFNLISKKQKRSMNAKQKRSHRKKQKGYKENEMFDLPDAQVED